MSSAKRLTLFCGHYGSGKTNIALNYALHLRQSGEAVTVADLDIVNPYFRTKDSRAELARAGVGLICSDYAGGNLDIPARPPSSTPSPMTVPAAWCWTSAGTTGARWCWGG